MLKDKKTSKNGQFKLKVRERSSKVLIIFGAGFLFILCFLVYRVVFRGEVYKKRADEQVISEIEIEAKRGRILDRNGHSIAVSGDVYRVDLDIVSINQTLERKATGETSEESLENVLIDKLASILNLDKEFVDSKVNAKLKSGADATSSILARRISKEQADAIKELDTYGILISSDTKRYYPNDEFASYVVGNVNADGKGLNGIEMYYDSVLSGISGYRIAGIDGDKEHELPLEGANYINPINGKDVILTIDEKIQYFAEKAAEKALKAHKADSVSVLVTEPNTNEILALVTNPDYNPNKPYEGFEGFKGETESEKIQQMWRNRVISNTYEPGSTFKIVTASAGVQEGIANRGETYVCGGYKLIQGTRINCWKREGHGPQTFSQIIENSCNVGFMEIGEKLGKEKLHEYITKFGFGKETGIDIIGEAIGIIKTPKTMSDVDLATISFGQANTVSMVQLLTGFNASINGGYLVKPHLMKEISSTTENGTLVINDSYKTEKTQVIDKKTSDVIKGALEETVATGTGKSAFIEGFRVIGKTGTAEMIDEENGGYGQGRIASFIAGAPANNPKISILVVVENPKVGAASGSSMAAPVVKEVLEGIYTYKGIEDLDFTQDNNSSIIMPEVRGLEVEEAKDIFKRENIEMKISGEGSRVKSLDVLTGSLIKKGAVVNVKLTKGQNFESKVVVPNFIGYTNDMIESVFNKIGLKYKLDNKIGIVERQSIEAGEVVNTGDTVKLILKKKE